MYTINNLIEDIVSITNKYEQLRCSEDFEQHLGDVLIDTLPVEKCTEKWFISNDTNYLRVHYWNQGLGWFDLVCTCSWDTNKYFVVKDKERNLFIFKKDLQLSEDERNDIITSDYWIEHEEWLKENGE